MNRHELIESILKEKELSHWSFKQGERFLKTLLCTIQWSVKKGDDVGLTGFGTFTKVKRSARVGVNPSTGAKIKIKAKTVPKFRPGKMFKELVR